jgi:hypothetical protein
LAKAVESVTARSDGSVLAAIEMFANLLGCVDPMIEVGDEGGDGAFKVNVVLPERVVGVDEEGLAGWMTSDLRGSVHRTIISLVEF